MKAKVFRYKSDGNTVVAPYMELEPYAENVYLSLSEKNEYGNEDEDCFHVVCKIENVCFSCGQYSRRFLNGENRREEAAAYCRNWIADTLQSAEKGSFVKLLSIRVFEALGLDTAPLLQAREAYKREQEQKRREMLEPYLKKADYQNGDVKQQVSNILKSVFSTYRFQSFGEYSALLSCFNIEAKQVRGEFEGTPYNGIVYTMTDDTGKPVCTPIKSSLIGKRFGYEGLEKRIGFNAREYKDKKWQPKIRNGVALAMHGCRGNREDFIRLLNRQGIDVVFRENNEGRIYGATFIDHKNREVYNGSRLGKEFSANAFERLFNGPNNIPDLDAPTPEISRQSSFSADMENAIGQAFGIFDFEANGPDPQEEALARRLQRKKKKKRRSRGIS